MLLDFSKETDVPAPPEVAWALIRDLPRLSGCVPGVSDLRELEPTGRYAATVSDKLGPFALQVPVEIELRQVEEGRRLAAGLSGNDRRGQARVKGELEANLEPLGGGTRLRLGMHIEVLGRLAALGATPMRRRADQIFAEFVRRLEAELQAGGGRTPGGGAVA
jgi:carbon monoxide dehydrogenase subunit G